MKPVKKTAPRFHCDHCNKTGVKRTIQQHESQCFRNPDRMCGECGNKGYTMLYRSDGEEIKSPCLRCERHRAILAYQNHVDGL